jgi:hypothetical protein
MNAEPLVLDGENLNPGLLVQAAQSTRPVALAETAWQRISVSRNIVDGIVESGQAAYGITTGVGSQKDFAVSSEAVSNFNQRLIKAHATRVPGPLLKAGQERDVGRIEGDATRIRGVRGAATGVQLPIRKLRPVSDTDCRRRDRLCGDACSSVGAA